MTTILISAWHIDEMFQKKIKLVEAGGKQMITSASVFGNVLNLFKVNNKGTKTASLTSFWCIYG